MLRDATAPGCDDSPLGIAPLEDEGDGTGDGPGHKGPESLHPQGDGNGGSAVCPGYGDGLLGNGAGGSFSGPVGSHAVALLNPDPEDFGAVVLYTRLFHERMSHETTQ